MTFEDSVERVRQIPLPDDTVIRQLNAKDCCAYCGAPVITPLIFCDSMCQHEYVVASRES